MMGKRILKVMSSLITTVLFIVLLLTLFLVISTKASGGEPSLFGYQLKTVLSGSMEPEIKTGSIVGIEETKDPTAYQKGDVITFSTEEDLLITHRITEVKQDGEVYTTKGDANNAADLDPVISDNYMGSYSVITIPFIAYVLIYIHY